jgi:hypothetical protein
MIDNEEAIKNGWTPSETDPGYLTKTIQHGNCTIIINRPNLSPAEEAKREAQIVRDLERALQNYVWKKEPEAAYDVEVKVEIEPKE